MISQLQQLPSWKKALHGREGLSRAWSAPRRAHLGRLRLQQLVLRALALRPDVDLGRRDVGVRGAHAVAALGHVDLELPRSARVDRLGRLRDARPGGAEL